MTDRQQGYRQDEHNNNASSAEESGYQVKQHNDLHTPPQVLIVLIVGAIILVSAASFYLRNRQGPTQNLQLLKNIQSRLSFHLVKDTAFSDIMLQPIDEQNEIVLQQPGNEQTASVSYKLEKMPALHGKNVTRAVVDKNDMNTDSIMISFDSVGAEQLAKISEQNIGIQLAMVYNHRVISAPVIQSRIVGGEAQITGRNVALILADLQPAEQQP